LLTSAGLGLGLGLESCGLGLGLGLGHCWTRYKSDGQCTNFVLFSVAIAFGV